MIECIECSELHDDFILFEEEYDDGNTVDLKCPNCKTKVRCDTIELSAAEILDWLHKHHSELYENIIKTYFKEKGVDI